MDNTVYEGKEHLTLEELEYYIGHLKNEWELFSKLYDVTSWYNNNTRGELVLSHASELENDVIRLINRSFRQDSECDWVAYFCYELSFGEAWYEGCITDDDGNDIKLATVEDLYHLLLNLYK